VTLATNNSLSIQLRTKEAILTTALHWREINFEGAFFGTFFWGELWGGIRLPCYHHRGTKLSRTRACTLVQPTYYQSDSVEGFKGKKWGLTQYSKIKWFRWLKIQEIKSTSLSIELDQQTICLIDWLLTYCILSSWLVEPLTLVICLFIKENQSSYPDLLKVSPKTKLGAQATGISYSRVMSAQPWPQRTTSSRGEGSTGAGEGRMRGELTCSSWRGACFRWSCGRHSRWCCWRPPSTCQARTPSRASFRLHPKFPQHFLI